MLALWDDLGSIRYLPGFELEAPGNQEPASGVALYRPATRPAAFPAEAKAPAANSRRWLAVAAGRTRVFHDPRFRALAKDHCKETWPPQGATDRELPVPLPGGARHRRYRVDRDPVNSMEEAVPDTLRTRSSDNWNVQDLQLS